MNSRSSFDCSNTAIAGPVVLDVLGVLVDYGPLSHVALAESGSAAAGIVVVDAVAIGCAAVAASGFAIDFGFAFPLVVPEMVAFLLGSVLVFVLDPLSVAAAAVAVYFFRGR